MSKQGEKRYISLYAISMMNMPAREIPEGKLPAGVDLQGKSWYTKSCKKDTYNKAVLQAACTMLCVIGRSLADIAEGKYKAE